MIISLSILPFFSINIAFNKVKIPGIVTLFLGIIDLILAFSLPLLFGWGYYGVALAGGIVLTMRSAFFVPWYTAKVLGIPSKTLIKPIISGVFALLGIAGLTVLFGKIFLISSWLNLTISCGIISLAYLIVVWYVGLNKFEQDIFIAFIPQKLRMIKDNKGDFSNR